MRQKLAGILAVAGLVVAVTAPVLAGSTQRPILGCDEPAPNPNPEPEPPQAP